MRTSNMTLAELKLKSNAQPDPSYPLRSWVVAARKTLEMAEKADRENDLEGAYVGYRKMANLLSAILGHKDYKALTSGPTKSREYYTYADLKAKVTPVTHRVRAIEKQLLEREEEEQRGGARQQRASQGGGGGSSSSAVESIASLPMEALPPSPSSSSGASGQPFVNGAPKQSRPPPPPTSTKPSLNGAGSATSPISPHRPGGKPGMSSSMAARMAALYNAGMEGAGEHAGSLAANQSPASAHSTGTSASSSSDHGPSGSGTSARPASNLKRSPAIHHVNLPSLAESHGGQDQTSPGAKWRQSLPQQPVSSSSSPFENNQSLPLPGSSMAGTSLGTSPSVYSQPSAAPTPRDSGFSGRALSPAKADDPSLNERPDSAPPAVEHGVAPASGPASTQHDFASPPLRHAEPPSSRPRLDTGDDLQARFRALQRPSAAAPQSAASTVDDSDFQNRFPDVDQEGFDILPSQQSAHDPIPRPYHPAPQSTSTAKGYSAPPGRSRPGSISSVRTEGTGGPHDGRIGSGSFGGSGGSGTGISSGVNGYTSYQLAQAAAAKPRPPAPPGQSGSGTRSSRPPLPKPPSAPSLPNLSSTSIQPAELWTYLDYAQTHPSGPSAPSILLLDVRTRREFSSGRIKGQAVCLEPFTLTPQSSAGSIESSLIVSPDAESAWFAERASFDLIVIYDNRTKALPRRSGSSSSAAGGFRNAPLSLASTHQQSREGDTESAEAKALVVLVSAIYEFNFSDEGKRLKRSPMLLVGGWEAWVKEVGEKGITRDAQAPPSSAASSYSQQTPPSAQPPSQLSAKEQEYQAMLANRARAESALASQASQGTSSSPESKRNHRKAVMSGDGLIAPMAPGLPPRHGENTSTYSPVQLPQAAYPSTGITVPPVAVHRTGPASPYEAYPSTPFRGSGYGRQNNGEYFNGSSASGGSGYASQVSPGQPHQPHSMGMVMSSAGYGMPQPQPSGSLAQQPPEMQGGMPPYPPPRPVDYPSLQQRHRLQNGSPARPTPPAYASRSGPSAHHVQIPQPVLARAPSGSYPDSSGSGAVAGRPSLQLLQNASYLTNQQFGDFPQQLTSLGNGVVGLTGLKNLGNTCYMNSMVQCLSATIPLARFLKEGSYKKAINKANPLGTKGVLADAVAQLVQSLWAQQYSFLAPVTFRDAICRFAPQFRGSDQHDSQEFLAFLLDGLHEDLNMVTTKPPPVEFTPEREAELESLPTQISAQREWNIYLRRDDSIIVRLFQGQYKSQLRCLTCGTTSTTYNTFMYLSLPLPSGKGISKVSIGQCIENFVRPETLEGDDAWNCPKCKKPRRALKALTLSRLPPILLIHLKRFSFHGPFTDKINTAVVFPVNALDLSPYMPPALDPAVEAQYASKAGGHGLEKVPRPVYDLHAISNHFGSLSSGHYTAYIKSRGAWNELNDSKIGKISEAQVAGAGTSAYTLWYSLRS